jgi:hypothetical protein
MEHKWVDRRDFLLMGSAAAVGIAVTSVSAGTLNAIARIDGANPILAIGFAAAGDSRVVAAETLRSSDAALADKVRVTMHGLWRDDSQSARPAVHVTAFFNHDGQALPFSAWSSVRSISPRVSFNVDLAGGQPLQLGIERERLVSLRSRMRRWVAAVPDTVPTVTALEKAGGLCVLGGDQTKLRRGTYFVALRGASSDRTPDWSSISFDGEQLRVDGESVLVRGNANAGFDFVAVSVAAV